MRKYPQTDSFAFHASLAGPAYILVPSNGVTLIAMSLLVRSSNQHLPMERFQLINGASFLYIYELKSIKDFGRRSIEECKISLEYWLP